MQSICHARNSSLRNLLVGSKLSSKSKRVLEGIGDLTYPVSIPLTSDNYCQPGVESLESLREAGTVSRLAGVDMDFEKLQQQVEQLEKAAASLPGGGAAAMKELAVGLRGALTALLKDRREAIRPGQIFKDAAAKNLVPGDVAPRGDALLIRWGGSVTPQDEQQIKDDAVKFAALSEKVLPVLKSYRKK